PQSSVFTGDSVTLRCEGIQSQYGWEFLWRKDSKTESTEAATKIIKTCVLQSSNSSYNKKTFIFFILNCCHCTEKAKPTMNIKPAQHVFRQETVTLRCDIYGEGVTSWQYYWYKEGSFRFVTKLQDHLFWSVTESDAGKYSCKVSEKEGSRWSQMSDEVTLTVSGFPKLTLIVKPESSVFTGDSVTLRCEGIQSQYGWEFLWRKDSNHESTEAATKVINHVRISDGGEYSCRARRKGYYTDYSAPVIVTIYEKPKPTVTIKPAQHVFRGETVTLRCDIYGEGVTSWQYYWYKEGSFRFVTKLQEHTFSSVTESDAGKYSCQGSETEGSRWSHVSDEVTLTVSGVSPPVTLIVSPSRTQHFTYASLSLNCEDQSNSNGWRVRRYTDDGGLEDCSSLRQGSQTGSTCTISSTVTTDTGVYWCESESGANHHPVNITVHSGVILESPVHPLPEGDNLILRCLYQHNPPSNLRVDFYKDGSLIQNQTTEMSITTVSKSHEGFYYCKHPTRGESPKSWISVRVTAGLTVAVLIIVFLVLLWCYRNVKG
uniref:Ig-like domain-containing protein n=1 Tax=Cyprinus carpio TaxID=7962 RepID=A0A8C1W121_CYPCA